MPDIRDYKSGLKLLNVGGRSHDFPIPARYDGWENIILDVDKKHGPDLHMDARNLGALPPMLYDAVLCAHTLEHFYWHDARTVMHGMYHVVKAGGWVQVLVPDIGAMMQAIADRNLPIDGVLYESPAGPITPLDMLYGYQREVRTGNEGFAHRWGYSARTLGDLMHQCGLRRVHALPAENILEINLIGYRPEKDNE